MFKTRPIDQARSLMIIFAKYFIFIVSNYQLITFIEAILTPNCVLFWHFILNKKIYSIALVLFY